MVYKVIGIMSGSSLDGLDIAYVHFSETAGKWHFDLLAASCYEYQKNWQDILRNAPRLSAKEYLLLHTRFGTYIGNHILQFIEENQLHHAVDIVASHGHTVFHLPENNMTAQLGDGAAIAAVTSLPVITDLRSLDVALGGQGAPIVPMGEKYLFDQYPLLLNIGGIANITCNEANNYLAFDICPANRVLNALANQLGKEYDEDGNLAAAGNINITLLNQLNEQEYYQKKFPKSLANEFGTAIILPLINNYNISLQDKLRTYTEHIAAQIMQAIINITANNRDHTEHELLITGGGAFNQFLIKRLQELLAPYSVKIIIPDGAIVKYKEALIMAFLGVLRWREQNTTLAAVTGAARDSIGGAVWMGQQYS